MVKLLNYWLVQLQGFKVAQNIYPSNGIANIKRYIKLRLQVPNPFDGKLLV